MRLAFTGLPQKMILILSQLKQGVKVTLQCLMCKGVIEQPFT
jgi:hypothetical protein